MKFSLQQLQASFDVQMRGEEVLLIALDRNRIYVFNGEEADLIVAFSNNRFASHCLLRMTNAQNIVRTKLARIYAANRARTLRNG